MTNEPSRGSAVCIFPISKRIFMIRRVAETFYLKSKIGRESYWRSQVGMLSRDLRRLGLDDGQIDACVVEFRGAVQSELEKHVYQQRFGGAA